MERKVKCWCYAVGRMVPVQGNVIRMLVADALEVFACGVDSCSKRGKSECLVGKQLQGRW